MTDKNHGSRSTKRATDRVGTIQMSRRRKRFRVKTADKIDGREDDDLEANPKRRSKQYEAEKIGQSKRVPAESEHGDSALEENVITRARARIG